MPNSLLPHALASTVDLGQSLLKQRQRQMHNTDRNNRYTTAAQNSPIWFPNVVGANMSPPVAEDRHNIFMEKKLKQICSRTITLRPTWTMSSKNYLVAGTGTIHGPNQICYVCKFFWYEIFRLSWIFFGPVTCEHASAYTTLLIPTEIDMHIRHRWSVCNSAALTTVHLMCLTLQSLAEADDGQLMLYLLTSKSRLPFSCFYKTWKMIPVCEWLITGVCKSPK